jgi:integrase
MASGLVAVGDFHLMLWRRLLMSIEDRRTKDGVLFRYDKTIRGVRIKSRYIFTSKRKALEVQAEAITDYLRTGKIWTHSISQGTQKTVLELLNERVAWLYENRSRVHAKQTENIFRLGLKFAPDWADKPLNAITLEMVRTWALLWKKDLKSRGKTAKSVNDALRAFQAAWNHPWDSVRAKPTYPNNPFAEMDRFPVEKKAKYVPETALIERILEAAQFDDTIFIYLNILYETGARPAEPLKLRWNEDVHFEMKNIDLYTKKNRGGKEKPRRVSVSNDLVELLSQWKKAHPNTIYVFQHREEDRKLSLASIRKLFKEACAIVGVEPFELNCWRHWRASKWIQEGMPLTEVQGKLGHSKPTMTDNYLHELQGF